MLRDNRDGISLDTITLVFRNTMKRKIGIPLNNNNNNIFSFT